MGGIPVSPWSSIIETSKHRRNGKKFVLDLFVRLSVKPVAGHYSRVGRCGLGFVF
jgi:hypothetical protein